MSTPQPGWYPDPHDPRRVRGRDGVRWSSHVGPAPHGDPSPGASGGHNGAAVDPTRPHAASAKLSAEYDELRERVVELREIAMLQEVGVYRYAHPLASAIAYKLRLQTIERHIHGAIKRGEAAVGALTWSVNGCTKEGARRVADLSKLMLRADSNEADGAVRAMKPYALDAAKRRLEQSRAILSRLGKRMQIHITDEYHRLRIEELELTADYLAKVPEEKECERDDKARPKEEAAARRKLEREQAKLEKGIREKERTRYESALLARRANGDTAGGARAEQKLVEFSQAIQGVTDRAANVRAGCVYVISNIGSIGDRVVTIGITRRLEPHGPRPRARRRPVPLLRRRVEIQMERRHRKQLMLAI